MKTALVEESYDLRLEKICPPYLEGHKNISKRIHWAIDELISRIGDNGHRQNTTRRNPEHCAAGPASDGADDLKPDDTG